MDEQMRDLTARNNLEYALRLALRHGSQRDPSRHIFLQHIEQSFGYVASVLAGDQHWSAEFREFRVNDPKPRNIVAPCFLDRVIHHALFQFAGPMFESRLLDGCCACRKGYGTQAAISRAIDMSHQKTWFLKLDVRHYFETVPRAGITSVVESIIPDGRLRDWMNLLHHSWKPDLNIGLPIGTLYSQYFANEYLSAIDAMLQQKVGERWVRYMDDIVVWADNKYELRDMAKECRSVATELGLVLKDPVLQPCLAGLPFLGLNIKPGQICYLAATNRRRKKRGGASLASSTARCRTRMGCA